jgi:hypothetical protein
MTGCSQESFEFAVHFSRRVVARFDGAGMNHRAEDRRNN